MVLLFSVFFLSCNNAKPVNKSAEAKRLFGEGFKFLDQRLNTPATDIEKIHLLNTKAIQKFDSSFNYDSTLLDAANFASECSYAEGDYNKCIYYHSILLHKDTSKSVIADHYLFIGLCYVNLGEIHNALPYLKSSLSLWKIIDPSDSVLITDNLKDISDKLFYKKNRNEVSNLISKGINPCRYSLTILDSIYSLNKDRSTLQLINIRAKNCQ